MNLALISLFILIVVVAIGFIKKVNLGFLSLGVAYFLGIAGGMSAKQIAAGFDSSMLLPWWASPSFSAWHPTTEPWTYFPKRWLHWWESIRC